MNRLAFQLVVTVDPGGLIRNQIEVGQMVWIEQAQVTGEFLAFFLSQTLIRTEAAGHQEIENKRRG